MDKINNYDVMPSPQNSTPKSYYTNSVLTVKEVQHILRIGQVNAYQLIRTPGFPVIKIGRAYRIPRDNFFQWLNSQYTSDDELEDEGCKEDE